MTTSSVPPFKNKARKQAARANEKAKLIKRSEREKKVLTEEEKNKKLFTVKKRQLLPSHAPPPTVRHVLRLVKTTRSALKQTLLFQALSFSPVDYNNPWW